VFGQASSSAEAVSRQSSARSVSAAAQSHTGSPLVLPFRGINGNSLLARRYREVAVAIADDLGGPDKLSEPTKILIRQTTTLTLQVEALQSKIVAGEDIDLEQLTRLSNVLGRTLQRLGLKRPSEAKAPSLLARLAESAR